ncbi:3'(2'),5'-bisphosphate nucleotidase CysQ [Pararhizobium mangrovi]|uniref:3'(2'),5'-bisphosphate nucleotidase CysQ n=1 Tax=Pararhizobium mangrovi TaxID=2590452 RepID=A0A506U0X8_9HYPH|nr:3'(2'),5'-bisphosphate nucleotidase CysQ [Pararhizobium mangrovi]
MSPDFDLDADLALLRATAEEAGEIALAYFRQDPHVWYKNGDRSPVSEADMAVDRLVRERLSAARPDYGWLSEESGRPAERRGRETLFVVDPIDGTRGFLSGETAWCVSLAVVHAGRPVAGVLVVPARDEVFAAHTRTPATLNDVAISVGAGKDDVLSIASPRRLVDRLPDALKDVVTTVGFIPSLAYRIAMVADGRLDGTLVREKANDWDIAAAAVILERAGGALVEADGTPVRCGGDPSAHGILLAGGPRVLPRLVEGMGGAPRH